MKAAFAIAFCALLAIGHPARAADRVKLTGGNQSVGDIKDMSANEITIEIRGATRKHPVNEIESVQFDGESNDLAQARIAVAAKRFGDAAERLEKVGASKREEIAAEIAFYKALTAAKLALAGQGSIADAGKKMNAFTNKHPSNFHYYEACEVIGDLLVALGKPADAEAYYKKLADAPWPDYKMRAGVLAGRALVGQKQFDKALARFEDVIKTDAPGKQAEEQRLAATLGKAAALAPKDNAAAVKIVNDVIAKAAPENHELHARAYNVLGNCYLAADKKKDALLAFLHVDLLYPNFPDQHAEALANLADLWTAVDKADRAAAARALLKEKYPASAWANK